jgi:hypothetical protein
VEKVVQSDQVAKYGPRLTMIDRELGFVHFDTDAKFMYLGPPLVVVAPLEAERMLFSLVCFYSDHVDRLSSASNLQVFGGCPSSI